MLSFFLKSFVKINKVNYISYTSILANNYKPNNENNSLYKDIDPHDYDLLANPYLYKPTYDEKINKDIDPCDYDLLVNPYLYKPNYNVKK